MAASRTMDPLIAYTNLTTNLPLWISEIHSLSKYAASKNAYFASEYTRLLANTQPKPKRVKSPSISSIHSHDEESVHLPQTEPDDTERPQPNPTQISPFEPGNKYLYAQARRKRKPGSPLPSGASEEKNHQSKQMVIIYYDKYLQDQLDAMVKKLGAARNDLRKAKAASTASRGFQLPRLGRKYDSILQPSPIKETKLSMSLSGKTANCPSADDPAAESVFDPLADSSFATTDGGLEAAQTLCETAAHQFLRDGDCKYELDSVPTKLDKVLDLANKAVQRIEADTKEKEALMEKEHDILPADSNETLISRPSLEPVGFGNKLAPTISNKIDSAHPLGLGTMDIEVDDGSDDDASMEIDIKNFRLYRSACLRS